MKHSRLKLLVLALAPFLHQSAHAQAARFEEVSAQRLPTGLAGPCMDAAAGDADGDGDLDLALAMEFRPNVLLLNDGAGNFSDGSDRLPRTRHDSEDVAFADFNGDGALDLVWVSEDDRQDELYLNDGTGRFSDGNAAMGAEDVSNALVVLDLDGDGNPDLLTGNVGSNRVLMGDGQGGFRDETAERWPQAEDSRTQDLELADVDGDGDLDVVVANEGRNQLFLNEDGRLVDVSASHLPDLQDESREIRAGDFDGDGDLDLVVANVRFLLTDLPPPRDVLLLNDGQGRFSAADESALPEDARSNFTVQAVDVDGDGDLDLLAPSTVFATPNLVFFVLARDEAGAMRIVRADNIDMRDSDGDGDLDVTAVIGGREGRFINEGGLVAQDAWLLEDATVPEPFDIDRDGRTDVAFGDLPLDAFQAGTGEAGTLYSRSELQLTDLDEDGVVDIVVPLRVTMDTVGDTLVLLNDGAGTFGRADAGTVFAGDAPGNGFDIEIADFNGDGADDLFFCNRASVSADADAAAATGGLPRLFFAR